MGEREEAVRRDPEVQQARRIADVARARLLECAGADDADALAEAQQMLDALRKAIILAAEAEDRARVHLGLLTQAEADHRATLRRAKPAAHATPVATTPPRRFVPALLARNTASAALLATLAVATAWLAARAMIRRRYRAR